MILIAKTDSDKPIKMGTKVDIWSTGCLISEIFSGIVPWSNEVKNDISLQKRLLDKKPFPIPAEIDDDIKYIISQCVKIDPVERINASQLSDLIRERLKEMEK